jgi:ACR3 family arsenite transporter
MGGLLRLLSRHARMCLIAGLATGLLFPTFATWLSLWLPFMVAALLTVTALRIGHTAARGATRDLRWGLGAVAVLQMALPLAFLGLLHALGLANTPVALALVLVTAAPAISGSTNLALLLGLDAGRMMQVMVLGTAAFPLTVLPVLLLSPQIGAPSDVLASAALVLLVILGATALGFILRAALYPTPSTAQIQTLDGASVLAFCVIVVALMAPLNAALRAAPGQVALWAFLAFAISYGLQAATLFALRKTALHTVAGPLAIGAGNRNIALFLVALPPDVLAPILIFIGCWQLPMYLTPILLPPLYRKALNNG